LPLGTPLQQQPQQRLLRFFPYLFFICFGLAGEVAFVAISNAINHVSYCSEPVSSMTGKTYLWMAPIYALIPWLFGLAYPRLAHLPLIARLTLYVVAVYAIEYLSGFAIEKATGKCPWEYTSGWHVSGYIRLDYFPIWLVAAYVVEKLHLLLTTIQQTMATPLPVGSSPPLDR
jgi:hypothetical protein